MHSYFSVDSHHFRRSIRVVGKWHKACGTMVDCIRSSPGSRGQVRTSWRERGPKYHRVYVLGTIRYVPALTSKSIPCTAERRVLVRKYS
jgi:hypothetical protein